MVRQETIQGLQACPHWAERTKNCNLVTNGLYLPVKSYAEIYCTGGNYSSCSLYMEQALNEDTVQPLSEGTGVINRRRDPRIPRQYQIQLKEYRNGNKVLGDAVMTVDISRGGMRLASSRSLPRGMEIFFSLKDEFLSEPVEGIGKIEWCQHLDNTGFYHAGISFSDPGLPLVVGESLIN